MINFSVFLFSVLLFLISLLTVVQPPTNLLWKVAILVQEAGHFLVLPCLLLALFSRSLACVLFLLSALLFGSPVIRSLFTAHRLEQSFTENMGKNLSSGSKFDRIHLVDWKQLFLGIPLPTIVPQTFEYVTAENKKYAMDFYSSTQSKAPCIVVIHGGGWDSGNRRDLEPLNRYLVGLGYAVAAVEYGLAPEYKYPSPVLDIKAAIGYLELNAVALGIDPHRFVLLGRSAGGQIAMQVAYDPAMVEKVIGVVGYYAPADMVFGYHLPCNPLVLDSRKLMENYLGGTYTQNAKAYLASSPIETVSRRSPATLILHGHADVLVAYEHSVRMKGKLEQLGVNQFTVDLPWATHGFDYVFLGPGSQLSLYFLERFLTQVSKVSRKDSDLTGLVK